MTLRQPTVPQLISTCCQATVRIAGSVTHYYVCMHCGEPADAVPSPKAIQR